MLFFFKLVLFVSGCWSLALPGLQQAIIPSRDNSPHFMDPTALRPTSNPENEPNVLQSLLQSTDQGPHSSHLMKEPINTTNRPVSSQQLSLSNVVANMNANTLQALINVLSREMNKEMNTTQTIGEMNSGAEQTVQPPEIHYHMTSQHQQHEQSGEQITVNQGKNILGAGMINQNQNVIDSHTQNLKPLQQMRPNAINDEKAEGGPHNQYYVQHPTMTETSQQQMMPLLSQQGTNGGSHTSLSQGQQTHNGFPMESQTGYQYQQTPDNNAHMYMNPVYMMATGMGNAYSPNMASHSQPTVGFSGSGVSTNGGFDPNALMEKLLSSNVQFNPSDYTTQQHFVSTKQWNFETEPSTGKVSPMTNNQNQAFPPTQTMGPSMSAEKDESLKIPTSNQLSNAQMNFEPGSMMTSLGNSKQEFAFDPDTLNVYGNGFHPGMMPQTSKENETSHSMYNADDVNKQLMTYGDSQQQQQQRQQEEHKVQNPFEYNPNTFNHPAINDVPKTYLQFTNGDEQKATQDMNVLTNLPTVTPSVHSQPKTKHMGSNLGLSKEAGSMVPYAAAFEVISYNPDQINSKQTSFNPDLVMHKLFSSLSTGMAKPMKLQRKGVKKGNLTIDSSSGLKNDTQPNTTGMTPVNSTTISSTIMTTIQPTTAATTLASATTFPTTLSTSKLPEEHTTSSHSEYNSFFLPNGANSGFDFKPGEMMGYGQSPINQFNNIDTSAFNPDQTYQASAFKPGVSPLISALANPSGNSGSKSNQENSLPVNGFNMGAMFDPSKVNNAKMSFDLNAQMGFGSSSSTSANEIFDLMKVNLQSVQNSVQSGTGGGFSGDTSAFIGTFDPTKVNIASMSNQFDSKKNGSVTNYMAMFLGSGGTGMKMDGLDLSAFGGNFNPADVNTAVFDPNAVNKVHMSFDPTDMLSHNPGYDKDEASSYTFDPDKINDVHMNFLPQFLQGGSDENNNKNETSDNQNSAKDEFIPGQLSPYTNSNAVFSPNSVNNAQMLFSPMGNQMPSGLSSTNNTSASFDPTAINNQAEMHFNPMSIMEKTDGDALHAGFDPNTVNNVQMNFNPNNMMAGSNFGSVGNSASATSGHTNAEQNLAISHEIAVGNKNQTVNADKHI